MDLGDLERWWKDPGIAIWSFVLFGCFLLNAILFLAFLIRPGLRTISNRFYVQRFKMTRHIRSRYSISTDKFLHMLIHYEKSNKKEKSQENKPREEL
ncbi:Melanopsin-B [Vespula squamosa]|uniref:Melanopsin-B n=1 Tax=Vespula squamosa TaxID=30214 RepID=A0ABD2AHJ0_VESSQ